MALIVAHHVQPHRCILLSCLPLKPCNEVRLLSRRIIIRLLGDVKKKVQKNLRASMTISSSSSLRCADLVFACARCALIASLAPSRRCSRPCSMPLRHSIARA
ncbi:hypothetical protein FCJ59_03465 [Cupriavidus basilensis]|nr:hypothetical protein [Cupriavidus basilensis]